MPPESTVNTENMGEDVEMRESRKKKRHSAKDRSESAPS